MVIEKILNIDISIMEKNEIIEVKQHDKNIYKIKTSLTINGENIEIPENAEIEVAIKKPDGYITFKDCFVEEEYICFLIDDNITANYGIASCEIKIYLTEEFLFNSPTFFIRIYQSAVNEKDIIGSDDFSSLTEKIAQVLKIQENLKVLIEQTESLFNDTQNLIEDIQNKLNSGEFNGSTPEIGDNGNWIIDGEDTGKPSVGEIPEIIPISQGGTGNNIGYIQTGKLSSTTAGEKATIEGVDNKASGKYSHAEGKKNFAKGNYSHAEGSNMNYDETELSNRKITSDIIPELSETITISGTSAYGMSSHAEGAQTLAFGDCSHAEGTWCVSGDKNAHSEGYNSQAVGDCSHAEGADTKASGAKSHAEGEFTRAEGAQSHSEGYRTVAKGACCHVQGRCNTIDNNSKYLHIVGNGVSDSNRKNCHTIDWQGNTWYSGNLYIGGNSQEDSESFVANVPKYNENNNNNVLMVKNGILTWVPIEEIS